jgi:hypothetical protein
MPVSDKLPVRGHAVISGVTVALAALLLQASVAGAMHDRSKHFLEGSHHVLAGGTAHRLGATLEVESGTSALRVSAGTEPGLLYRVSTPDGSGIRPLASLNHGILRVSQTSDGKARGAQTMDIRLARGVRWTINLDGGATSERINMERGALSSLTFGAGVSTASVKLPTPDGTLTLTLAGGATQLLVSAPPGAPAAVKVAGGASQVSLDGISQSGVSGGSVFADPGWSSSHNRYFINLLSGVSNFRMSRK